jgi:hypothetical protein
MKSYNYRSRNALILMITCVVFLNGYTASQSMGSELQSRRATIATSASARSVKDPARLIVHRIPNLGNNVIVDLYVDGVAITPIGYGHTYEGFIPSGRHVLSVLPSPRAIWRTPWQMTLDVRSGETYNFTAMDDDSGHLILKGS